MHHDLDANRDGRRGSSRHRGGRLAAAIAAAVASSIATVALTLPAGASPSATIAVSQNKTWGPILQLSNGQTVYLLTKDTKNHSVCTGACAKAWPPVVVSKGGHPQGNGVSNLGTIKRAGGKLQVTYEGIPLYTFVGDHAAGDVTGNIKDKFGQWYVVNPTHPQTVPTETSGSSTTGSHSSGSVGY
jgi:predicted lipoprotein with Yx(FWY)xxD motif